VRTKNTTSLVAARVIKNRKFDIQGADIERKIDGCGPRARKLGDPPGFPPDDRRADWASFTDLGLFDASSLRGFEEPDARSLRCAGRARHSRASGVVGKGDVRFLSVQRPQRFRERQAGGYDANERRRDSRLGQPHETASVRALGLRVLIRLLPLRASRTVG
jgi:hypothetical protein